MKKCLIVRLGAYGDLLMVTPVLPYLKRDGYHITLNIKEYGKAIFKNNPHVDDYIIHDETIPLDGLEKHWEKLSEGYDKVINLSGSIEQKYLIRNDNELYYCDKSERQTDVNYYDEMFRLAGYDITGKLPELYIDNMERQWIKKQRKRYKGFIILWSLSGSALHKAWPYVEDVARHILDKYTNLWVMTTGDAYCYALEWTHKRTIATSGTESIRYALLRTKMADLVIGAETGIINASGCWDVPKIIFYTHSSHQNLSKYFKNCYPIQSDAPCSPCYRLIEFNEKNPDGNCNPVGSVGNASLCMARIDPQKVIEKIEHVIETKMPNM